MRTAPLVEASDTINLLSLDEPSMGRLVQKLGWPTYRTHQILRWLYRSRAHTVSEMTDLSRSERDRLSDCAVISRSPHYRVYTSHDATKKIVLTLSDGRTVESVLIPDEDRLTVCLSSQVGCTLDCGFCLTGTMALARNLKAHEIVDQVLTAQESCAPQHITNLVFMGMGEPLANFEAVSDSIRRLTNKKWGLGVSPRRITVSTAGLADRLHDVAPLGVNLAISLNAATDQIRSQLMPTANRLHSLRRLLAACRNYPLPPHRRLTFEYVLLAGMNDREEDARQLGRLVRGIRCKINLIPFNPFPGSLFQRPTDSAVAAFQDVLRRTGLDTFVRKSRGRDVLGACGQLGNLAADSSVTLTQIESRC
jgi:23S rRNA (adenine2503-C2)-methyltransferase